MAQHNVVDEYNHEIANSYIYLTLVSKDKGKVISAKKFIYFWQTKYE